jgi:hypothetical protein
MSALAVPTPLPTGVPTVTPLEPRYITGSFGYVLGEVGRYKDTGELIRYDKPVEHRDGTASVWVWLNPTHEVPPLEVYRVRRRWDLGDITALAAPVVLGAVLLTVYRSAPVFLGVLTTAGVGAALLTAGLWVSSKVRGTRGCPGIRVHCDGCDSH